jgi:hypothetical protein
MKKQTLSLILICFASTSQAQLHVESNGDVKINTSSVVSRFTVYDGNGKGAINGQALGTSSQTSTYGNKISAITGSSSHLGYEYSIGVHGTALGNTSNVKGYCSGVVGEAAGGENGHNYGVCGHVSYNVNGAAVYGTSNDNLLGPTLSTNYAGFFNGVLAASGPIYGMVTSPAASDSNPNITIVDDLSTRSQSDLIGALKAKTLCVTGGDLADPSRMHYVLDADQLEELYPDLVVKSEDGSKGINYVEMVPILVQAINELKAEITELRGSETKPQTRAVDSNETGEDITLLSLGDNRPNPFSNTTKISVSIPADVQKAFIYVYDLTGKKVLQLDIPARGKQDVTLDASALTDGMYLYSLIADGKVVQTRRMIVEK